MPGSRASILAAFVLMFVSLGEAPAQEAEDFAGEWMSNFGPMTLVAKGKKVSGHSGWEKETKLNGVVEDGVIVLSWKGSSGSGTVSLELWEGGGFLGGKYQAKGGNEGVWNAYRKAQLAPKPTPGEMSEGQTSAGLRVHLHVPKTWRRKPAREAILILHGSNMTARAYVNTIVGAFPKLAEDFVIVGLDGENMSPGASAKNLAFNYSYVNFSGAGVGPTWAQNQSPALVAASIEELGEQLEIERWIVGGHSQGGFLSYAVAMFYPELVVGAFPMSCNLLTQCEPGNFENKKVRTAQRALPFAVVHGRNDPVVDFSGANYCRRAFEDAGFPAIGFFDHPNAAHMFARLPVEDAVRWIAAQSSEDPKVLAELAAYELEMEHPRRASAAARRALEQKAKGGAKTRAEKALSKLDKSIAKEAKELTKRVKANKDGAWVEDFWEFRSKYALLEAAQPVLEAYSKLRKKHEKKADELFWAARNERDDAKRKAKYREIVEKWYASKWTPVVKEWI